MIRKKPIHTEECDSFDEVRKLLDEVHAVLQIQNKRLLRIETKTDNSKAKRSKR